MPRCFVIWCLHSAGNRTDRYGLARQPDRHDHAFGHAIYTQTGLSDMGRIELRDLTVTG
jgi:hypothetical protein